MALPLIFWTCFLLVVYTYVLYPAVLFLASSVAQLWRGAGTTIETGPLPAVSMIIPAHNEERHLPAKLANLTALQYPNERLEILFVSDGSTDPTNEMLQRAAGANITLLVLRTRGGKQAALNRAFGRARHIMPDFSHA